MNPSSSASIPPSMPSSGPTTSTTPLPASSSPAIIGLADTTCNECRRRKGRCDRILPECGPCARNQRHCLYARHARTPLTRKYLTEVEERLRQAEARWRALEARIWALEARERAVGLPTAGAVGERERSGRTERGKGVEGSRTGGGEADGGVDESQVVLPSAATAAVGEITVGEKPEGGDPLGPNRFETAPGEADDFDWDEQADFERPVSRQVTGGEAEGEMALFDGMASLSIDDRGAGYLGMASGAAMLKLLMPEVGSRGTPRDRPGGPVSGQRSDPDPGWVPTPVYHERRIAEIDLDAAIDSYFALFHLSHPLVHEPTFRAQYAQVIPRVGGRCWNALAYMLAAIGLHTTSTDCDGRDGDLFEAAKSNITLGSLESGNITLVQVLTLMSNYLQKRDKPNSGYNYLGLALHMAMGLGLHKEFQNWSTSHLNMEIRRRVWWTLYNLFSGAMVTFGRPVSWPSSGIEVGLPLNIDDRDLTYASNTVPASRTGLTTHSAIAIQARFHLATNDIYARLIAVPFPSASELVRLDDDRIESWRRLWLNDPEQVPLKFLISHKILEWRYYHFKTIIYRSFLLKHALHTQSQVDKDELDANTRVAIDRCLNAASSIIHSVSHFWTVGDHNNMTAWYSLYYLFQASLILSLVLRNDPGASDSAERQGQIKQVLKMIKSMWPISPSSRQCHRVILRLCRDVFSVEETNQNTPFVDPNQSNESPDTQLESFYSMLWPNTNQADTDMFLPDESWNAFVNEIPEDIV